MNIFKINFILTLLSKMKSIINRIKIKFLHVEVPQYNDFKNIFGNEGIRINDDLLNKANTTNYYNNIGDSFNIFIFNRIVY